MSCIGTLFGEWRNAIIEGTLFPFCEARPLSCLGRVRDARLFYPQGPTQKHIAASYHRLASAPLSCALLSRWLKASIDSV